MTPEVIYDFIYADHERVASILAQLGDAGSPTASEHAYSQSRSNESGIEGRISPFNFFDIGAKYGGEREWGKEVRLAYDPLWANTRKLIHHVEQNNSGNDNPSYEVGRIAIHKGFLIAYDLSWLKGVAEAESMVDFVARNAAVSDEFNSDNPEDLQQEKIREAKVTVEYLKRLPLGVAFVLISNDRIFWFALKRNFLTINEADIPFKYPIVIDGDWSVLGIIDARPFNHDAMLSFIMGRSGPSLLPEMAQKMIPTAVLASQAFGRPAGAHGISPLAVFRNIEL